MSQINTIEKQCAEAMARIVKHINAAAGQHKRAMGKAFAEVRFNHFRKFERRDVVRINTGAWRGKNGAVEQYQDGEVLLRVAAYTPDGSPTASWIQVPEHKLELVRGAA